MNEQNENIDIDEAIASGDPDLMEKALAQLAENDDAENLSENGVADQQDSNGAPSQESEDAAAEEATEKVVKSKDGKHEIPYSVLEQERAQRKALEQELLEMRSHQTKTENALNNVKARLEAQGADVEEMFSSPDDITESQWEELEADYGVLGKMMRKLVTQQQSNEQAINQAEGSQIGTNEQQELQAAIQANPDLAQWQQNDPDRWVEATRIDAILRDKPEWADKTYQQRFAEVERLVKKSFGDDVAEAKSRAKQRINEQTGNDLPTSLSDMGGSPVQGKSDYEALKDLPAHELEARMATMSSAQIDALFAQGF